MDLEEAFYRAMELYSNGTTGSEWEPLLSEAEKAGPNSFLGQLVLRAWHLQSGSHCEITQGKSTLVELGRLFTDLSSVSRFGFLPGQGPAVLFEDVDLAAIQEVYVALTGTALDLPEHLQRVTLASRVDAVYDLLSYMAVRQDVGRAILGGGLLTQFLIAAHSQAAFLPEQAGKLLASIGVAEHADAMSRKEAAQLRAFETQLFEGRLTGQVGGQGDEEA